MAFKFNQKLLNWRLAILIIKYSSFSKGLGKHRSFVLFIFVFFLFKI